MMMVPAYVSCSESSRFVTSLYTLTQFNTNGATLTLTLTGQLRAHSLHPDYLPHSTTIPIPHSTSPTPPPIYRGVLKETVPKDSTQPADQI